MKAAFGCWPFLSAAAISCVFTLAGAGAHRQAYAQAAGAGGAGGLITVTYRKGYLVDTVSGQVVSRQGGHLVLRVEREGEAEIVTIPFADLREIEGEAAPIVIGRWRKQSADAAAGGESAGEMVTVVYRETFSVKTAYGQLLDRGGKFIKLQVDSGGRTRVLMILRTDVKTINGEPADLVFARWDEAVPTAAAAPRGDEPLGPPVVLRYKDGYVLNGIAGPLVRRDMRRVVVRAAVDGRVRDVAVPWKDIREYNNRPASEEMKRLRRENEHRLCPACKGGTVLVKCDKCAGTGLVSDTYETCRACKETGQVPCRAPGCNGGYLECPGPCLKRSRGRWVKNWDGKFWIKFKYGDGQFVAFSEDKIGQVVKRIDGVPRIVGPCHVCGGKGKVPCPVCDGTGQEPCPRCNGKGKIPSRADARPCPYCDDGIVPCQKCGGTGLLPEKNKQDEKKEGQGPPP